MQKPRTNVTLAVLAASMAAGAANADVIYQSASERPDYVYLSTGFEDRQAGTTVSSIDFGFDLIASVTTSNNISNHIFSVTDGYGAVAAEGDKFWKLAGGTTTLDFGQTKLRGIEFMYSDLEWTTLSFEFDNGNSFTFRDSNSMDPRLLGFAGTRDNPFQSVSITWVGTQNDGVGIDQLAIAPVPAPAGLAALAPLALLGTRRRRAA